MATRVYAFTATCPAGTPASAPVAQVTSFPPVPVEAIELIVPDGHSGLTGIAIQQAHQAVIPLNAGQFLITNDEKMNFPVQDYLDNGDWQVIMYNTDVYPHSFYLRFLCQDAPGPLAVAAQVPAQVPAGLPLLPVPSPGSGVAPVPAV